MRDAAWWRAYRADRRGGPPRQLAPCGSYAAARRHQRNGEPLDGACVDALAEHQRAMYERRKP